MWSAHRSNWNKQDCKTDSDKDQLALSRHFSENHAIINKPPLHEAYNVTFVEQPSCHSLDICENKWCYPTDAQINIQNMILPMLNNYYDALCCLTQSDVVFRFVR